MRDSSIRIPAALNGLYGLRPSYHRIPYRGAVDSLEGQESIPSVFGPISSSLFGVKLFMKSVIDAKPWLKDPLVMRKPWDQQGYELSEHGNGKGLVFGIIWDDGHEKPHPPILRALELTQRALTAAGHKGASRHISIYLYLHFYTQSLVGNHTNISTFVLLVEASSEQEAARTCWLLSRLPMSPSWSPCPQNRTIAKLQFLTFQIRVLDLMSCGSCRRRNRSFEQNTWTTGKRLPQQLVLIVPWMLSYPPLLLMLLHLMATTCKATFDSHSPNEFDPSYRDCNYTTVWNVLDCPGLVFPVTTVDPVLDLAKPPHEFLSDNDKLIYELCKFTSKKILCYLSPLRCRHSGEVQGCTCGAAASCTAPGR